MPLRVIVSGSRTITDRVVVHHALERVVHRLGIREADVTGVMHGGATGVDQVAGDWASVGRGWPTVVVPYAAGGEVCSWCLEPATDGAKCAHCGNSPAVGDRRAWGKVRNRLMLQRAMRGWSASDVLWIAVWDGYSPGTAHAIATAAVAGVRLGVEVIR